MLGGGYKSHRCCPRPTFGVCMHILQLREEEESICPVKIFIFVRYVLVYAHLHKLMLYLSFPSLLISSINDSTFLRIQIASSPPPPSPPTSHPTILSSLEGSSTSSAYPQQHREFVTFHYTLTIDISSSFKLNNPQTE